MATLTKTEIVVNSNSGKRYSYDFNTYVDSKGVFSIAIQPKKFSEHGLIAEFIQRLRESGERFAGVQLLDRIDDTYSKRYSGEMRMSSDSIDVLRKRLHEILTRYVSCECRVEKVISFSFQASLRYFTDGVTVSPVKQEGMVEVEEGKHNSWGNQEKSIIALEFYAQCRNKNIYTSSAAKEEISYSAPDFKTDDSWGEYAEKLNSWNLRNMHSRYFRFSDGANDCIKEIPYTEQAAQYFHELLTSLCTVHSIFRSMFDEPETLQSVIKNYAGKLLLEEIEREGVVICGSKD